MRKARLIFARLGLTGALTAALCAAVVPVLSAAELQFETAGPLENKDSGKTETSIGDLVADSLCYALKVDIAFVASSELKPTEAPIPAGQAAVSAVTSLISYPNDPLAVIELTGAALRAALERSVGAYPQPSVGFLQVSGVQFSFDPAKPRGRRVTQITASGAPLKDDSRYRVAVTNSLANGANGYWKVWSAGDIKEKAAEMTLVKAVESFLRENNRVDYRKLRRIALAEN